VVRRACFVAPPSRFVQKRVRVVDASAHAGRVVSRGRPARRWLALLGVAVLAACDESGTEVGAPPVLVSLTVAPLELTPPFSPDVHDYVIRCGPGPNSLQVATQTAPGALATLQMPGPPTRVAPDAVSLNLNEDDALVVHVTADGQPEEQYWVRCLPHDFPGIRFTPHPDAGTAAPSWYLLGNIPAQSHETGFAMVLDPRGTPVWYRRVSPAGVFNVDRRSDGSISYVANLGYYGADPSARYIIQTLQPWKTRSLAAVGAPIDEHELQVLPNGDALVLAYSSVANVDLTGLAGYGPNETIADCAIQEIDPSGRLVWQWRARDHVDPVRESTGPEVYPVDGQSVIDVFHLNSIDVDDQGNLLVSARNLDAVFYVEKASGKIVWKMGGAAYSKDGARIVRIVGDPQTAFSRQHDGRLQPNGHVSVFDDHTAAPGVARGVEYAVDVQAGTATFVWQYLGSVSSLAMGSCRRYDDGVRLIAWGFSSQPTAFAGAFTEIDDEGRDLLDASFVQGDATYRAVRVPLDAFDIDVLRETAGRP